ncbi:MAG: nicotinate phosphoribosyltransferase [Pseudonocardiaceae bacterium]
MTEKSEGAAPVWRCPPAPCLVTDLYEVSMALVYLRQGRTGLATFSLTVRELPPDRGFLVPSGLADALDFLEGLDIGEEELAAFADALERPLPDLAPLRGLHFTGDVWAVPEGRVVLAGEPLLEVTAPLPQAQLVETFLLNQLVHQTALASKAARCVLAAQGIPVVDFGLRRSHGVEAGMHASRAGAVVGFAGTSNVAAARRYGLAASGTVAHSFIESFPDEAQAFQAFAQESRGPVTLLVDTYNTDRGVQIALDVLRRLPAHRPGGPAGQRGSGSARGARPPRSRRGWPARSADRGQRRAGRVRHRRSCRCRRPGRRLCGGDQGGHLGRRPVSRRGLQIGGVRRQAGDEALPRQGHRTGRQTGLSRSATL